MSNQKAHSIPTPPQDTSISDTSPPESAIPPTENESVPVRASNASLQQASGLMVTATNHTSYSVEENTSSSRPSNCETGNSSSGPESNGESSVLPSMDNIAPAKIPPMPDNETLERLLTSQNTPRIAPQRPQPLPPLHVHIDPVLTPSTLSSFPARTDSQSSKRRAVDEFGFFLDSPDSNAPTKLGDKASKVYRKQEISWIALLDSWEKTNRYPSKRKVKRMCREGIPDSVRARAWYRLCNAGDMKRNGLFEQLKKSNEHPAIFDVIERDVHRCYPDHIMFAEPDGFGQTHLRQILRAYALYNPTIGYCQGMGMIVGILLMRMPPEETFWVLVSILDKYLKNYHSNNLYALRVDTAVFEMLMMKHASALGKHFRKAQVPPFTFTTQWFLTVFTMALPWQTVLRIWDMFMFDGVKAMFRAGLATLLSRKYEILRNCPTAADVLQCILHIDPRYLQPTRFIETCLSLRITHSEVERYRRRVKMKRASLQEEMNAVSL